MAGVATKGKSISSVTASGHVPINYYTSGYCRTYDPENPNVCIDWVSGYNTSGTASATIDGEVNSGSSNVFVNGVGVARNGDSTTERDTANIPSGWSRNGGDTGGSGSVSGGASNVYANSSKVALSGTSVRTHAGVNTSISGGSSNVYAN